ncbi:MAG: L-serine ammonia-lyase, iron-sulfur-dependent, subunit alpha [Treponema sp.]|nr:L-serine ammonia-lyase, iron-sulfur-dependent, subunit alpha [Treponema sp.]
MLNYHSVAELASEAERAGRRISDIVLDDQAEYLETPREAVFQTMKEYLGVMRESAEKGAAEDIKSTSGLTGGDAWRMARRAEGDAISGPFCARAISRALAVNECNASMGKIIAAPTAGSCGILPAAVLTMMEEKGVPEEKAVMALITAGALGMVIVNQASIAGAEGGCQAACGSAAALAAGAMVEMSGGSPGMVAEACAIALKNQLGLVCDPVAGLVEVPCVKRNAGGIMCAIGAADMALGGIKSVIPVDEVIAAMREVGEAMASTLKETALGGLAATPTGLALKRKVFG